MDFDEAIILTLVKRRIAIVRQNNRPSCQSKQRCRWAIAYNTLNAMNNWTGSTG
jgi:hypothetical protein